MNKDMETLQEEIRSLKALLRQNQEDSREGYYFFNQALDEFAGMREIPDQGMNAKTVKTIIENNHALDFIRS